jgi:ribosome biogenesis GTPase A
MNDERSPLQVMYDGYHICDDLWYDLYRHGEDIFAEEYYEQIREHINDAKSAIRYFNTELDDILNGNIPLSIGFVGGFNSGKSTLINSILGYELLGMDQLPATAKITVIEYGEFGIFKKTTDGDYEEISYEDYNKYVLHDHSKQKPPKDASEIDHFLIRIPNPLLQELTLVDTPGFSSISEDDDNVTVEWLGKVDILFWVIDPNVQGTIPAKELKILENEDLDRIFLIINWADSLTPAKSKRVAEKLAEKHAFKKILYYAAKPILDDRNLLNDRYTTIEKVQERYSDLSDNNPNLSLQVMETVAKITDTETGKAVVEESIPYVAELSHIKDYEIMIECLSESRSEMIEYKQSQIISSLSDGLDQHVNKISQYGSVASEQRAAYEKTKKQIERKLNKIEKTLQDELESELEDIEESLRSTLHRELFSVKGDGGLFDTGIFEDNYISPKEISDSKMKRMESIVNSVFATIFDDTHERLVSLLEKAEIGYDLGLNHHMFDSFKQILVSTSLQALQTIQLWARIPSNSNNQSYIMGWVTSLIASWGAARMTYLYLVFSKFHTQNEHFRQLDLLIYQCEQIENAIKEAFNSDDS